MRRASLLLSASLFTLAASAASAQNATPHNLILFVPDGLRALKVTPESAPAMAAVRDKGVNLRNSHSMFPTFTTANASAMATGHYLGDTGDFSNTIYTGYTSVPAGDTTVPFLENDAVLADVDDHFKGDYLDEETVLKMAREKGLSTAAIGKVGPTLIFDHADRGKNTIVVDDFHRRQDRRPPLRRGEGRPRRSRRLPAAATPPSRYSSHRFGNSFSIRRLRSTKTAPARQRRSPTAGR